MSFLPLVIFIPLKETCMANLVEIDGDFYLLNLEKLIIGKIRSTTRRTKPGSALVYVHSCLTCVCNDNKLQINLILGGNMKQTPSIFKCCC